MAKYWLTASTLVALFLAWPVDGARNKFPSNKPEFSTVNRAHPWALGLVAAYLFGEPSGSFTYDSVHGQRLGDFNSHGNNLGNGFVDRRFIPVYTNPDLNNGITNHATPAGGGQVRSVWFSAGDSDILTGSDAYLPSGGQAFSFLTHVATRVVNPGCIWNFGTFGVAGEYRGLRFQNTTTIQFLFWTNELNGTIPTATVQTGYYIAGSFDTVSSFLYYSLTPGRLTKIASQAQPNINLVKTGTLTIGKSNFNNDFFDGWIDYIYFWNVNVPLEEFNAITLSPYDMFIPTSPVWPRYNLSVGGGVRHRAISQ